MIAIASSKCHFLYRRRQGWREAKEKPLHIKYNEKGGGEIIFYLLSIPPFTSKFWLSKNAVEDMIVESIDYVTIIHHAFSHFFLSLPDRLDIHPPFQIYLLSIFNPPRMFLFIFGHMPSRIEQTKQQQQPKVDRFLHLLTCPSSILWWDESGVEARLPGMTIVSPESSTWWLAWTRTSGRRTTLYWLLSPRPPLPPRPPDGSYEKWTLPVCDTKTHCTLNDDSL